jgi:hypothetical protein
MLAPRVVVVPLKKSLSTPVPVSVVGEWFSLVAQEWKLENRQN